MTGQEFDQRILDFKTNIDQKFSQYRKRQIQQYELEALKRLPEKLGNAIPNEDVAYWLGRFEEVSNQLPTPTENGTPFVKAKNQLFRDLNKKYKIQRKGQWTAIMLPVFMSSIGVAIGVSTGNLALWIPIGIIIGLVVGRTIDKNAEKKGLVF